MAMPKVKKGDALAADEKYAEVCDPHTPRQTSPPRAHLLLLCALTRARHGP